MSQIKDLIFTTNLPSESSIPVIINAIPFQFLKPLTMESSSTLSQFSHLKHQQIQNITQIKSPTLYISILGQAPIISYLVKRAPNLSDSALVS